MTLGKVKVRVQTISVCVPPGDGDLCSDDQWMNSEYILWNVALSFIAMMKGAAGGAVCV